MYYWHAVLSSFIHLTIIFSISQTKLDTLWSKRGAEVKSVELDMTLQTTLRG